jgi:hypothetical protein
MNQLPPHRLLLHIQLLALTLPLFACSTERIVTHDPHYQTDYQQGQIYTFKKDALAFLVNPNGREPFNVHWMVEEINEFSEQHLSDPQLQGKVKKIPKGTKIRFEFLGNYRNPMRDDTSPYAKFLDGPLPGTTADLTLISRRRPNPVPQINSDILEVSTTNLTQ